MINLSVYDSFKETFVDQTDYAIQDLFILFFIYFIYICLKISAQGSQDEQ